MSRASGFNYLWRPFEAMYLRSFRSPLLVTIIISYYAVLFARDILRQCARARANTQNILAFLSLLSTKLVKILLAFLSSVHESS